MPGRGTKQQMAGRIAELEDASAALQGRIEQLEAAVDENRRLNERLSDVIDVVTEVLVPAVDRDDERLKAALGRLDQTLS